MDDITIEVGDDNRGPCTVRFELSECKAPDYYVNINMMDSTYMYGDARIPLKKLIEAIERLKKGIEGYDKEATEAARAMDAQIEQ